MTSSALHRALTDCACESLASKLAEALRLTAGSRLGSPPKRRTSQQPRARAHAEADALGANIVRAGVLREASPSDKRNWEADGFAQLRGFVKTEANYPEIVQRAAIAAAPKEPRQQAIKDNIIAAAAEIDPGHARQPHRAGLAEPAGTQGSRPRPGRGEAA